MEAGAEAAEGAGAGAAEGGDGAREVWWSAATTCGDCARRQSAAMTRGGGGRGEGGRTRRGRGRRPEQGFAEVGRRRGARRRRGVEDLGNFGERGVDPLLKPHSNDL